MNQEIRLPLGVAVVFHITRLQGMMLYYCKKLIVSRDIDSMPYIKDRPIIISSASGIFLVPVMSCAAYFLYSRILNPESSPTSLIDFVFNISITFKITFDCVTAYVVCFKRKQIIETANILLNTLGLLEALGKDKRIKVAWGRCFSVCVVFCFVADIAQQTVHVNSFIKRPFYLKIGPILGALMRATSILHFVCFCVLIERGFLLVNLSLESIQNRKDRTFSDTAERPAPLLRRLRVLYARLETITNAVCEIYGPMLFSIYILGRIVLIFDTFVFIKMDQNFSHITYFVASCIVLFRLWMVCRYSHGLVREAERSNELTALLDSSTWDERARFEFRNMSRTTRLNLPRVSAFNIVSVDYSFLVSTGASSITYIILLTQIPSNIPDDNVFNTPNEHNENYTQRTP